MSTATHAHDPHDAHGHGVAHDHHGPPAGFTRWMYTTNHKDIGTMYLWFACFMFFLGGTLAMLLPPELFHPRLQFPDPQFFNSLTTIHGLELVFVPILPAFVGSANLLAPTPTWAARLA